MAVEYLNCVINAQYPTRTHKLVMIILANYADEQGESYPGIGKIATLCQLSERQVQKILADLVEAKLLDRQLNQSKYNTNVYRIKGEAHDMVKPTTGCRPVHPPGEAHDTPPVKPSSPNTKVDTKVDTKVYARARAKGVPTKERKEVARQQWNHYKNEAIRVYLEVFHRPINDYEANLITRNITADIPAWRNTCEVWQENEYNESNIADMIKRYKRSLEVDGNEVERATNISTVMKQRLERMQKEGNISPDAVKKVLAGELVIKSNPQGFYYITKNTA